LVFLIFLLFLAKLNITSLILLLFLLVTPSQFAEKRLYIFLLAIIAVLFLIEAVGWNWIGSTNLDSLLLEEANPRKQILYILGYPLTFLLTAVKDIGSNGLLYVQGWINGYGYYYWTPPQIVSVLFLLSLATVIVMDSTVEQVSKKYRVIFLVMFVAGYLATILSLYISFTPVGSDQVFGVQGRYFVPLALPLVLVFSSLLRSRTINVPSPRGTIILLAIALSLNLWGLSLSFHVPCGLTFYQTGLCYRPLVRDFLSDVRASQPVADDTVLSQDFEVTCNGLAEVRVLLTPSETAELGITRFVIHDSSSEQAVLDQSIANGPIGAETWYPLRFEPDWFSAGKRYTLEILGTSPVPNQGLQFYYTPQPEFDLGDAYEDGQLLEEDLVLQYGCVTGLRKIWLTGRS
jgi:hypothetical protein